jgi:hypothetical protein
MWGIKSIKISYVAFFLAAIVFALDQFDPRLLRTCTQPDLILTKSQAKAYALKYWHENPNRAQYGTTRYPTAEALLAGAEEDGKWEIAQEWHALHLATYWYVGFSIYKYNPDYYSIGIIFNKCGYVFNHVKV